VAGYRIICIGQLNSETGHRHIANVGIGRDAGNVGSKWTIEAVRDSLDTGHRFYTVNRAGIEVEVVPVDCSCGAETITLDTTALDDPDEPLLPSCQWVDRRAKEGVRSTARSD